MPKGSAEGTVWEAVSPKPKKKGISAKAVSAFAPPSSPAPSAATFRRSSSSSSTEAALSRQRGSFLQSSSSGALVDEDDYYAPSPAPTKPLRERLTFGRFDTPLEPNVAHHLPEDLMLVVDADGGVKWQSKSETPEPKKPKEPPPGESSSSSKKGEKDEANKAEEPVKAEDESPKGGGRKN